MFGKILYIGESEAHVENLIKDANSADLMNVNVIFEDSKGTILGEVEELNENIIRKLIKEKIKWRNMRKMRDKYIYKFYDEVNQVLEGDYKIILEPNRDIQEDWIEYDKVKWEMEEGISQLVEKLLKENKEIYTDSSFKENYGWQVDNVQVFDEPIEAKGHLSLWEYNIEK